MCYACACVCLALKELFQEAVCSLILPVSVSSFFFFIAAASVAWLPHCSRFFPANTRLGLCAQWWSLCRDGIQQQPSLSYYASHGTAINPDFHRQCAPAESAQNLCCPHVNFTLVLMILFHSTKFAFHLGKFMLVFFCALC